MSKQKKAKHETISQAGNLSRFELPLFAVLAILFIVHAKHFDFIQDDAFITFRYIKNFIAGQGLVFNFGEHVEGYTTFLWTMLLAVPAKLGIDIVSSAQNLGLLCGLAVLLLVYLLSKKISVAPRPFGLVLVTVLLLVANSSLAYWAISGMESVLFTALTLLGVLLYLQERKSERLVAFTPFVFVLLSLTRPEGMYFFGLTILHMLYEWILVKDPVARRKQLKRIVAWIFMFGVPTGIFMLWRLSYYGYLFPNTFYAKAGISREYLSAGFDYFWLFAKEYLVWGVLLVVPLYAIWRRRWQSEMLYIAGLVVCYTAYVIVVGGDVLRVFRFFLPILPLVYLLVQEGFCEFYADRRARRSMARYLAYAAPIVLAIFTYTNLKTDIEQYAMLENGLVNKMAQTGIWIKNHSTDRTVVAASTIGAVSYYSDVTLVDMLGLTDETIAHHPEKIFGVRSSWKERNYNVTYVLSRKPDWILFSTGIKPSAFAERALFTREDFRRWYYPYFFHPSGDANEIDVMYKRSDVPRPAADSAMETAKTVDNEFINLYYDGMNRTRSNPRDALSYFRKALAIAPPDFALIYQDIAGAYRALNQPQEALKYYEKSLSIDDRMVESHIVLGLYARDRHDTTAARAHFERLVQIDPDYSFGWTTLGELYASAGDREHARAAFEQAVRVAPNNSEAYSNLQRIGARESNNQ